MSEALLRSLFQTAPAVVQGAEQRGQDRAARLLEEEMARAQLQSQRGQMNLARRREDRLSPDSQIDFQRQLGEIRNQQAIDRALRLQELGLAGEDDDDLNPLQEESLARAQLEREKLLAVTAVRAAMASSGLTPDSPVLVARAQELYPNVDPNLIREAWLMEQRRQPDEDPIERAIIESMGGGGGATLSPLPTGPTERR